MSTAKLSTIIAACYLLLGCGVATQTPQLSSTKATTGLSGGFGPNETLHVYSSSHSGQRRGIVKSTGDRYNYGPIARNIEIIPAEASSSGSASSPLVPKRVEVLGGCSKDKVSDQTVCRLNILPQGTNQKGGLYQTVDLNGSLLSSCVIGHDYPGKTASIRIDGNPAFTTNDKGCIAGSQAAALERQLRDGKQLITRRIEWPYKDMRDKELIIDGSFSTALELYRWSATANLAQLFSMR